MSIRNVVVSVAASMLLWSSVMSGPARAGDVYAATDLGTFGGGFQSFGYGVNDAGQVVGHSITAVGATHAFRSGAGDGA